MFPVFKNQKFRHPYAKNLTVTRINFYEPSLHSYRIISLRSIKSEKLIIQASEPIFFNNLA